jgi:hypothetical protein
MPGDRLAVIVDRCWIPLAVTPPDRDRAAFEGLL